MTNLFNKISKLAMIPILAGSLNGCERNEEINYKIGDLNGDGDSTDYFISKGTLYANSIAFISKGKGIYDKCEIEIYDGYPFYRTEDGGLYSYNGAFMNKEGKFININSRKLK